MWLHLETSWNVNHYAGSCMCARTVQGWNSPSFICHGGIPFDPLCSFPRWDEGYCCGIGKGGTLLNLKFSPFAFDHYVLCRQVEIHLHQINANILRLWHIHTHTCTVCLILAGMHPYIVGQLLQVEMRRGQILCHHSWTGCLDGGVTHND